MIKRIVLSLSMFLCLWSLYQLYLVRVAPLFDPGLPTLPAQARPPETKIPEGHIPPLLGPPAAAIEMAKTAFGAGAPELKAEYIWRISADQGTVFFYTDHYEQLPDGQLLVRPFSLVVHQEAKGAESGRPVATGSAEAAVHETPSGAESLEASEEALSAEDDMAAESQSAAGAGADAPVSTAGIGEARPDSNPSPSQITTIRCPEARLQFDKPLDMAQLKVGKPNGGSLDGAVEIRHRREGEAPEKELMLQTRDLRFAESAQRVWTDARMLFQSGSHRGEGQGLDLFLIPDTSAKPSRDKPAVAGIRSIRLRRDVHLTLPMAPDSGPLGNLAATPSAGSPSGAAPQPLEVRCDGPFRFDLESNTADFLNAVRVLYHVPDSQPDQLQCQRLTLVLDRRGDASSQGALQPENVALRELRARGSPVLLESPSRKLHVLAGELVHDAVRRRTMLRNEKEVVIVQQDGEIHAAQIELEQDEQGQIASALSEGPGWFQLRRAADEGGPMQGRWQQRLRLGRKGQEHVLNLVGGSAIEQGPDNMLQAEQIQLWLRPTAGGTAEGSGPRRSEPALAGSRGRQAGDMGLAPSRLVAWGKVKIVSPQLAGRTQRLEMWFDEEQPAAGAPAGPSAAGSSPGGGTTPAAPGLLDVGTAGSEGEEDGTLEIEAELLKAQLIRGAREARLAQLWAEGEVHVTQQAGGTAGAQPLVLFGQTLHLTGAQRPESTLRLTGAPAGVHSPEMHLQGRVLDMDRAANRLHVEGAGVLQLPVQQDLEGRRLAKPGQLQITWTEGLRFDGTLAVFRGGVHAELEPSDLRCHILEVTLSEPISFARPNQRSEKPIEIRQVVCRPDPEAPGSLVSLHKEVQEEGRVVELQDAEARLLTLNVESGDVQADGPGRVTSVQAGEAPAFGRAAGANQRAQLKEGAPRAADAKAEREAEPLPSGLKYVRVTYTGVMQGNLQRRHAVFQEGVDVVYAPIQDASDRVDPRRLPEDGLRLRCQGLELWQQAEGVGGGGGVGVAGMREGGPVELLARGNANVEIHKNGRLHAQADRIAYSEIKDQLILEGEGENSARLWRQVRRGQTPDTLESRKITYYPRTQEVKTEDAQGLNVGR